MEPLKILFLGFSVGGPRFRVRFRISGFVVSVFFSVFRELTNLSLSYTPSPKAFRKNCESLGV